MWQLGAEPALRGRRVVLEDLDQAKHLSAMYAEYPLGLDLLQLNGDPRGGDLVIRTPRQRPIVRALRLPAPRGLGPGPVKGLSKPPSRPCRCSWTGSMRQITRSCWRSCQRCTRTAALRPDAGSSSCTCSLSATGVPEVLAPISDLASIAD